MIPRPCLLKSRRARSLCLCLLALLIASIVLVRRAFVFSPAGQTFTVTNTNDTGVGISEISEVATNLNATNNSATAEALRPAPRTVPQFSQQAAAGAATSNLFSASVAG